MITEFPDRYEIDLADAAVRRCVVDHAFTLDLDKAGRYITIRIETPFEFMRGGSILRLEPEAKPEELGPALSLSRTAVATAVARIDGSLELVFRNESAISVQSDEEFEAWTVTVTGGPMMVGGPGDQVTIFPQHGDVPRF